jgi:hypothetical protein
MSHCEPPLSPRNVLRLTAHPPDLKLIAAGLGIAYAIGCEAMTNANHNDGEQTNFIFGRPPDRENLGGRAAVAPDSIFGSCRGQEGWKRLETLVTLMTFCY